MEQKLAENDPTIKVMKKILHRLVAQKKKKKNEVSATNNTENIFTWTLKILTVVYR